MTNQYTIFLICLKTLSLLLKANNIKSVLMLTSN